MADLDWGSFNAPAIWEMLKNENVCTGADRVLSWDALAQEVRDQHKRLLAATAQLTEAWSPESNVSASLFLGRLSTFANSMDETLTKAEDTRAGLQGVLNALAVAQSALSPIMELRGKASQDVIPRIVDGAEDDFDRQAQQTMRNAEAAVRDHTAQIQAPAPFEMTAWLDDGGTDVPVEPGPGHKQSEPSSVRANPKPVPVPNHPPSFFTGSPAGGADPMQSYSGPELAGIAPTIPSTAPGLPQAGVVPVGPGGGQGLVIGPGGLGSRPGGLSPRGGGGAAIGMPGSRAGGTAGRQTLPIRKGLPSGAVIGAPPGKGGLVSARVSQGPALMSGQQRGRDRAQGTSATTPTGEADHVWGVADGVAPVIRPDNRQVTHDPGPGVIGRDR